MPAGPDPALAPQTAAGVAPGVTPQANIIAGILAGPQATVAKSPVTGESTKETVKTICAGKAGCFR
jgi:hypothetical protein